MTPKSNAATSVAFIIIAVVVVVVVGDSRAHAQSAEAAALFMTATS